MKMIQVTEVTQNGQKVRHLVEVDLSKLPHKVGWYCCACKTALTGLDISPPIGRWDKKRGKLCPLCFKEAADWVALYSQGGNLVPAWELKGGAL